MVGGRSLCCNRLEFGVVCCFVGVISSLVFFGALAVLKVLMARVEEP